MDILLLLFIYTGAFAGLLMLSKVAFAILIKLSGSKLSFREIMRRL